MFGMSEQQHLYFDYYFCMFDILTDYGDQMGLGQLEAHLVSIVRLNTKNKKNTQMKIKVLQV